jgi:hypothetical protein
MLVFTCGIMRGEQGKGLQPLAKAGKTAWKTEKDVTIERTNPVSSLESTKVSKNEPKTNWFLSAKMPKRTQKWPKNHRFAPRRSGICGSRSTGG